LCLGGRGLGLGEGCELGKADSSLRFGMTSLFRASRPIWSEQIEKRRGRKTGRTLVHLAVLMAAVDGPDFGFVFFERVDVDHPVEDDGMELAAVGVAVFFG